MKTHQKLVLAMALASAFALPISTNLARAEGDESKQDRDGKGGLTSLLIAEGEDEKKSESSQLIAEGEDEKKSESSQLTV